MCCWGRWSLRSVLSCVFRRVRRRARRRRSRRTRGGAVGSPAVSAPSPSSGRCVEAPERSRSSVRPRSVRRARRLRTGRRSRCPGAAATRRASSATGAARRVPSASACAAAGVSAVTRASRPLLVWLRRMLMSPSSSGCSAMRACVAPWRAAISIVARIDVDHLLHADTRAPTARSQRPPGRPLLAPVAAAAEATAGSTRPCRHTALACAGTAPRCGARGASCATPRSESCARRVRPAAAAAAPVPARLGPRRDAVSAAGGRLPACGGGGRAADAARRERRAQALPRALRGPPRRRVPWAPARRRRARGWRRPEPGVARRRGLRRPRRRAQLRTAGRPAWRWSLPRGGARAHAAGVAARGPCAARRAGAGGPGARYGRPLRPRRFAGRGHALAAARRPRSAEVVARWRTRASSAPRPGAPSLPARLRVRPEAVAARAGARCRAAPGRVFSPRWRSAAAVRRRARRRRGSPAGAGAARAALAARGGGRRFALCGVARRRVAPCAGGAVDGGLPAAVRPRVRVVACALRLAA